MYFSFLSTEDIDLIAQFERKIYGYEDAFLERIILPIEAWNKDEIVRICKEKYVRAFYVKQDNKICGWICYRISGVNCEILKITIDEAKGTEEIFTGILDILKEKVKDPHEKVKITWDLVESREDLMKLAAKAKFSCKLLKKSKKDIDTEDVFRYTLVI